MYRVSNEDFLKLSDKYHITTITLHKLILKEFTYTTMGS